MRQRLVGVRFERMHRGLLRGKQRRFAGQVRQTFIEQSKMPGTLEELLHLRAAITYLG